jgi:hypothetical protein
VIVATYRNVFSIKQTRNDIGSLGSLAGLYAMNSNAPLGSCPISSAVIRYTALIYKNKMLYVPNNDKHHYRQKVKIPRYC